MYNTVKETPKGVTQMKRMSLLELAQTQFVVSGISILIWTWSDGSVNDYLKTGRTHNLIFFQDRGEREYQFSDGAQFLMPPNSMILIPDGACYHTRAITLPQGDSHGYNALFDLYDAQGEPIQLTDEFVLDDTPECASTLTLFQALNRHFSRYPRRQLSAVADIYQILDRFCRCLERREGGGGEMGESVAPAVHLIQEMPEREFTVDELCRLCRMSESTFRRHFHAQTGLSPIAFRNLMRVQKAKLIYDQALASVEEIAEQLGFCDAAYLCRTCKKLTGKTFSER